MKEPLLLLFSPSFPLHLKYRLRYIKIVYEVKQDEAVTFACINSKRIKSKMQCCWACIYIYIFRGHQQTWRTRSNIAKRGSSNSGRVQERTSIMHKRKRLGLITSTQLLPRLISRHSFCANVRRCKCRLYQNQQTESSQTQTTESFKQDGWLQTSNILAMFRWLRD